MPLIKRVRTVEFEAFENELMGWKMDADIAAQFGVVETEGDRWTAGAPTDKSLTLLLKIEGYPSEETGKSTQRGEGWWLLSQASLEAQKAAPVELIADSATSEWRGWQVDPFPGQLWLYQGRAYFSDDQQTLASEDVRALINVESN